MYVIDDDDDDDDDDDVVVAVAVGVVQSGLLTFRAYTDAVHTLRVIPVITGHGTFPCIVTGEDH